MSFAFDVRKVVYFKLYIRIDAGVALGTDAVSAGFEVVPNGVNCKL